MSTAVALIVDIVDSRKLPDRAAAQREVEELFARAEEHWPAGEPLWATVGDEFQALYPDPGSALAATTYVSCLLETCAIRCGIGVGEAHRVDGAGERIQDGSAWWAAREAIDEAHRRQSAGAPAVRSWSAGHPCAPSLNSFLLVRDHVIGRMKARELRITAAVLAGSTQQELAESERISQPAVSQNLHRSGGAAVIAALDELREAPR